MPQIMITLNEIRAWSPCVDGWAKLLAAKGKTTSDGEPFPLSDILETNDLDDCLWALRCTPESLRPLWRKFAVWAARQVQHLMKDERSKNALDVAERHANGEATDEELRAAGDAAWAAARAAAGDAAGDAAWAAARAAAGDAAWAAAWAAATWAAARAAAGDAAWAAAGDAQFKKLRQILDAGEWVE